MVTRVDYTGEGLDESDVADTPLEQLRRWTDEATAAAEELPGIGEPMAMAVATVDADLVPNVRVVLIRFLDARGPGFVTSRHSTKAAELAAHDTIAGTWSWPALYRAIRVRGRAVELEAAELADYWDGRPWGSRISARVSRQSHPVDSRAVLEEAFAEQARRYPDDGRPVPPPRDWVGYRIDCTEVEFWAGRRDRLHDRLVYARVADGDLGAAAAWRVVRRQP